MSMRQGWTHDEVHFAKTTTERGGTRYFIDGRPTRPDAWREQMSSARYRDETRSIRLIPEDGQ